jgi:hypothetical protein
MYLAIIDPFASGHLNLCLFSLAGIESCPGCGVGKSISHIFHGNLMHSIETHALGIFALVIIIYRIISLLYKNYKLNKTLLEVNNA